ncbi:Xyloglucan galactosyltransferase KATAMARI1 [Morella rubra]|uniref:Xyloglucan galactosyltransferase KATAMARI1 n=1 Tax=Morella rubra TaxID=262757 RepID=A0A6A1WL50_9ROSI|nr:Xyloglucan galactosyltransferase KATAMARI1 [Morella rubra]KAB1225952.1 Xyloglucan galactosyltransferase KATAMARI1 [Morella rubra]
MIDRLHMDIFDWRLNQKSTTYWRRSCTKVYRPVMERPIIAKLRKQLWLAVLTSFLLLFLLLCFYNSARLLGKPGVTSFGYIFANSVYFGDSSYVVLPAKSNGSLDELPNKGNYTTGETRDFIKPLGDMEIVRDIVVENMDETKTSYNPFGNSSAPDYGLESSDRVMVSETEVRPNNQTQLTENEVLSEDRVSSSENEEESDDEVAIDQNRLEPVGSLSMADGGNQGLTKETGNEDGTDVDSSFDSCSGRYIYVHDLPSQFNDDMLKDCRSLSIWNDMCTFTSNIGLGPTLPNSESVFSNTGWFETNQFFLEVIFHNRMKQYECLTNDSSFASAIYVPYYAGLDVARYLWYSNTSMRDAGSLEVVKWVREKPEWEKMWGRDHFVVAGRITWDFRREGDQDSDWGNKLMFLPESRNMTMLAIESSPWSNNDVAIPYPTYFHPSTDHEVFQWQNRMRSRKRMYLFSFAGAPRPKLQNSIRGEIIEQCQASRTKCKLLECSRGSKCYEPVYVMKMFQSSVFCLQPPGDSYTRRSAFDSILAGCIPVFFHPGSAYVQYIWHLPKDYTKYSVFIHSNDVKQGKVSIEKILLQIPKEKVQAMREEVIRQIPRVIYADPRSRLETLEDAFDLTVKGVLERVESIRRKMREGKNISDNFEEELTWKHDLTGTVGEHEWDEFFSDIL